MTKTIDVKGLDHAQREKTVFPAIEALPPQETLRVIMEFNPVPLVYLLETRGNFDVSYEKEGPTEWILNIKKTSNGSEKEYLKKLLRELKAGNVNEATLEKAKTFLEQVDAKTLGMLEQELIKEGVSHEEIRGSLCDLHLDIMRDALVKKRIEVSAPHPIHTFMEEHKVIINTLNELGDIVGRLKGKKSFEDMGDDVEKLKEASHHLVEAESHHQREEEALFPKLEKHQVTEPPSIMRMDHIEFRQRKQKLYKIAYNPKDYKFLDYKKEVIALGEYITKELESHIFKEDNILYQIALQVLRKEEWDEVQKDCDKIGYCCFTPEKHKT